MQWIYQNRGFDPARLAFEESLFSLGNGYLGIRASLEEVPDFEGSIRGSYINGIYERVPMQHAEMAFGFPTEQDKQPRIIDTQTVNIFLDKERITLKSSNCIDFERQLDLETGIYSRTYKYITADGREAQVSFKRIASLVYPQHFVYRIHIVYDGVIRVESVLETEVKNYVNPDDPRVGSNHGQLVKPIVVVGEGPLAYAVVATEKTKIEQAVAINHIALSDRGFISLNASVCGSQVIHTAAAEGGITLEKQCVFSDSLRSKMPLEDVKDKVELYGFDAIAKSQKQFLTQYWDNFGIEIHSQKVDALTLRWMQFQLLQALGRDIFSNMAAKGLSGEGYEGHYFWDTEIYGIPAALFTMPDRAKSLIGFRYRLLGKAKERAIELGHLRGAAYPWRTISGIESSGYFPAGTAQYHLNADIAYGVIQYHLAHKDWDWMRDELFELLFETALIWLEIGHRQDETYRICAVTGPDEYTAIVNNNYYTNTMAKYHLTWVVKLHKDLCSRFGDQFTSKWGTNNHILDLDHMEWAASHMWLPKDDARHMAAQDDAFLSKPVWPFHKPEFQKRPLLLHYHPLTIYRHQVLKQADAVLAQLLVEEGCDDDFLANTYDYYEGLTTHDSSLSACIYGMMASRLGRTEIAYDFFKKTLELDLNDTHGNTKDGLHLANIAGGILSLYQGFAGIRLTESAVVLRPTLPKAWDGYRFGLAVHSGHLSMSLERLHETEQLKLTLSWTQNGILPMTIHVMRKEGIIELQLSSECPQWQGVL